MKWIKFFAEYVKSPRTVGAVAPSSQKLAEKMIASIDFNNAGCIIEYGSGTGVFTEKLVKNKMKDTILVLVEYNRTFYEQLMDNYNKYNNIVIINDSAENVCKHLKEYNIKSVDYVVSGLPFASLPKDVSRRILKTTTKILVKNGLFITFQYTLLKKEFISGYFSHLNYERVLFNLPPAYVLKCRI